MTNTTPEMKQFAEEVGLKAQDMPPANHPLFENDADVKTLGDLVDARTENNYDDIAEGDRDDGSTGKTAFDEVDEEDEYMTREDFVANGMLDADPDEDVGDDDDEMISGAGINRAPDITGTVQGIAPGMSTHVPLDLGADGFQVVEPEDVGDLRASAIDVTNYDLASALEDLAENDPYDPALADDESEGDGHRIPINDDANETTATKDDALDGTRRMR